MGDEIFWILFEGAPFPSPPPVVMQRRLYRISKLFSFKLTKKENDDEIRIN